MADWQSITFKFTALDPLKPPLKSTLKALEAIESILEALLALIRPFLLDLLNPLRAIVALLLAAIRAILNQIRATGFSVLLVHPDFSQQDFGAVLNSASGAYPKFESKVVGKFFDTSDVFRPMYPPGSTVGMLVLYIGADSPGDLMSQLFALLALINQPSTLSGLPAPVGLKVRPTKKSGDSISQFRQLFDSDLTTSLALEWRMPEGPSGMNARGFVGQMSAFFNSFRFPNFLVERTDETSPQGEVLNLPVQTTTLGPGVDALIERYSFPAVSSNVAVREDSGNVYRNFTVKIPVSGTSLLRGALTGSYRYLDKDSALEPGKTYYYRVRAYFGDISNYLAAITVEELSNSGLIKTSGNSRIITYGSGVVMGKPSPVVKGFVPLAVPTAVAFNAYTDISSAIVAGLMLNFEFPPAGPGDSQFEQDQKTGWGTLGILGGQIGPLKAAFDNSKDFRDYYFVRTTARRLTNSVLTHLYTQPQAFDLLAKKWVGGAQQATEQVLTEETTWRFIGIVGGLTPNAQDDINSYLALESTYVTGNPFNGPLPINLDSPSTLGVESRRTLADFIQTATSMTSTEIGYLGWYSVTVGDLFPALLPFMFDLEQFLLAFLKALESAIKEIEDIIKTIIQKIKDLETILATLLALLDLLDVNVRVSVLGVGPIQGGATDLVSALQQSTSKPTSSPFGLHSGMVMTFGGPGSGSLAALQALKFILSIP